jgi:hypothetical protein
MIERSGRTWRNISDAMRRTVETVIIALLSISVPLTSLSIALLKVH